MEVPPEVFMLKFWFFVLLLLTTLTASCGGGGVGDLCFDDIDCDEGLICVDGECV